MHKTLGDALFALGYRKSVWVNFVNINKHDFGAFAPAAPLLDFAKRYGAPAQRKGDLVGERFAAFVAQDVIRHPSNPLGIEANETYVLRDGERYDCAMTTTGADIAAYDSYFRPKHAALFPVTTPSPTPKPPTTPKPTPPPTTPAPIPPKPPATPEAQRVEELLAMLRAALYGFRAPILRPGIDAFLASEFARLALLRAVQVYREIMGA